MIFYVNISPVVLFDSFNYYINLTSAVVIFRCLMSMLAILYLEWNKSCLLVFVASSQLILIGG